MFYWSVINIPDGINSKTKPFFFFSFQGELSIFQDCPRWLEGKLLLGIPYDFVRIFFIFLF